MRTFLKKRGMFLWIPLLLLTQGLSCRAEGSMPRIVFVDSAESEENETNGNSAESEKDETSGDYTESAGSGLLTSGDSAEPEKDGTNGNSAESAGSDLLTIEETTAAEEKLETLLSQVESMLPVSNGDWSVCVVDLASGAEAASDESPMQAASLIKLYIMGAVYENYENLTAQYGADSVDTYLYSMITVSDNVAANTLVSYLGYGDSGAGMAVVNDYCTDHGYDDSSMGRLLLQSNENGDNYTSVSDCAHFLQNVYEGDTEECPYADRMYSLLKAQTRRNKIPAQMPSEVGVANKTGELADVENDAGILYDTENDLILVFMSENLSDVGAAQSTIASLSRMIYDYY